VCIFFMSSTNPNFGGTISLHSSAVGTPSKCRYRTLVCNFSYVKYQNVGTVPLHLTFFMPSTNPNFGGTISLYSSALGTPQVAGTVPLCVIFSLCQVPKRRYRTLAFNLLYGFKLPGRYKIEIPSITCNLEVHC